MSGFAFAFATVIGNEGGFTTDPSDPGNWTGGASGRGVLRGTKFGISAAAFPTLDIASLSLDQAQTIYRLRYWAPLCAGSMPPPLALLVFDAAVNGGVRRAALLVQETVGVIADGLIGPASLAAIERRVAQADLEWLCAEFQARRLLFMTGLAEWHRFGPGWARRLCRLPFQAMRAAA